MCYGKRLVGCTIACIFAILLCMGSAAQAKESIGRKEAIVEKELTVKSGKWAVARMRNMNDNVALAIGIQSQGPIMCLVLSETQMKKFPKISDPLLMARVDGMFALQTDVRKGGNYYLLFWNKYSELPVSLKFKARVRFLEGV